MAQIIISKETSQGRGATQLDAARKTFIMRVAVFIIFLPRLILVPMLAAVASQTTNLHLKQQKGRTKGALDTAQAEAEGNESVDDAVACFIFAPRRHLPKGFILRH